MSEQYISALHSDHKLWLSELTLAKDELKSQQLRLQEVNAANTNNEIRAQVEHFQNQFIRQQEVIDELVHDIKLNESALAAEVVSNQTASDHRKVEDHPELRERMVIFNKLFSELKADFLRFVSDSL